MEKILSICKYIIVGVSILSVASLIFMSQDDAASLMLNWAYVLIGLTLAVTVLMPLIGLAQNPKAALSSLISVVIIGGIAGVCYAIGDATPVVNSAGGLFENPVELKLSDMGLYLAYISLAAALIVSIVGEVINSFK